MSEIVPAPTVDQLFALKRTELEDYLSKIDVAALRWKLQLEIRLLRDALDEFEAQMRHAEEVLDKKISRFENALKAHGLIPGE